MIANQITGISGLINLQIDAAIKHGHNQVCFTIYRAGYVLDGVEFFPEAQAAIISALRVSGYEVHSPHAENENEFGHDSSINWYNIYIYFDR